MGCHTWFYRPITKEEREIFKSHAIQCAEHLYGDTSVNRVYGFVDLEEIERVRQSVENDTEYWIDYGYGTFFMDEDEKEYGDHLLKVNGIVYIDLAYRFRPIIPKEKCYHDVFRVKNYPTKTIHSRYQLRKWMGKDYFKLENWQLETISEFFRENPGGFICFG